MNKKSILVTGGTGSFGKAFCEFVLKHYKPARLIVYSRDEFKQSEMQKDDIFKHKAMRFFIGDIRDAARLTRAMQDVDIVIHAAALKQVVAAEYNPDEFIKTNVNGAANIIEAALFAKVKRVIALSTDKAVNPANLYGATKLCSDKLFIAANNYAGKNPTRFSIVRYGNVWGSRGSVGPLFAEQANTGTVTITDPLMTRFVISLEQAVKFVTDSLKVMKGGELYVPKIPSVRITDVATALAPNAKQKIVGIRPGEKLHEILISQQEAILAKEFATRYVISAKNKHVLSTQPYASNTNEHFLTTEEIRRL